MNKYCSSESLLRLVNVENCSKTQSSFKGKTLHLYVILIMQLIFVKEKKNVLSDLLQVQMCLFIHPSVEVEVDGCCPTFQDNTKV